MPKNLVEIFKIIRIINPDVINHQGMNRMYFMKISNILNIPFLTGFCFWQDIFNLNKDNINIGILKNNELEKTDIFKDIIKYSYTYSSSNFVNDVIHKLYNIRLDVIETISLKEDFYINEYHEQKYVTIVNCHYNKGGYLIEYLCKELDKNIPLLLVYTEHDCKLTIDYIQKLIDKRNKINNINLFIPKKIDIKDVYKKTKILLQASLCDETFCRVAYEAMINNIHIIKCGNKYRSEYSYNLINGSHIFFHNR